MVTCKKCGKEMEKIGPPISMSNTRMQKVTCKTCNITEVKALGF